MDALEKRTFLMIDDQTPRKGRIWNQLMRLRISLLISDHGINRHLVEGQSIHCVSHITIGLSRHVCNFVRKKLRSAVDTFDLRIKGDYASSSDHGDFSLRVGYENCFKDMSI